MPEELRVGLLSCGGMARALARSLNTSGRARIAMVCDVLESAASAFGTALDVPWTTRIEDVLSDGSIRAVIVATPNHTHADVVEQAAAAGKHIFCEKPMALSVADCDRMLTATEAAGVHLCIGQVLRYLPVFEHTHRLIAEGRIGRPFAMRISRLGGWGETQSWRQRRATCGGPLFEINIHELDFMRYILGEPEVVYATGSQSVVSTVDFEDTALVTVRFAGGGHAVLHSSIGSAIPDYTAVIQGSEGTLAFRNGDSVEWKRPDGQGGRLQGEALAVPDAHLRELSHLIDAVLDGVPPAISGRDGRAAVAMAEAAVRSIQTGAPVALPPMG